MINIKNRSTFFLLLSLVCLHSFPAQAADKLPNSAFSFDLVPDKSKPHLYLGVAPGIGQASGTAFPTNSGFVYDVTVGMEQNKSFGLALTYQHDSISYSYSSAKSSIHQIFVEANVFSLLVLNGGLHIGDVIKVEPGLRTADLGLGLHIGLDVNIAANITAGVQGYWTLVLEDEDHHSLLNLLLPVKYWFN